MQQNIGLTEGLISKKVCVLGDPAVGKTSLVIRFVDNTFNEKYVTTLGANISRKKVQLKKHGRDVTLVLWDVCGQKEFKLTHDAAVRNSHGFIFVGDVSRKETMGGLRYWIDTAFGVGGVRPAVILGNKSDLLENPSRFYSSELSDLSKANNIKFFLTSAKSDKNVNDAVESLCALLIS